MTTLLNEPRIAYASRKVQRLREDVKAWHTDRGVLEDQIRDANHFAEDFFTFDRESTEMYASRSSSFSNRAVELLQRYADVVSRWATMATEIIDTVAPIGPDTGAVAGLDQLREHLETANRIVASPTARLFQKLVEVWKAETGYLSSPTAMTSHWAYQRIIQLGQPVVPLLLRELQRELDFWFTALKTITGVDPVPPEARGRVAEMAEAWVRWGQSNNLI